MKLILTICVGILVYWQFQKLQLHTFQQVEVSNYLSLITAIILLFFNYLFDFIKWNEILKMEPISTPVSIKFQSFFAGIITAMLTPNMQGNFLGRIYYFPRKRRIDITLLTLTSNLGQFITTLILGLIALQITQEMNQFYYSFILISCLILLLFYFNFEKIKWFNKRFKWLKNIQHQLTVHSSIRWKFLFYSILRNSVFSFQFLLLLHAFGVEFSWLLYFAIWNLYVLITISPSLFLGKLFIRESIAIWLLSKYGINEWVIIVSSLSIWVINLLIPTLLGLIICKKSKKWKPA